MWSIRPNIERQSTLRRVRIALVANPRSGRGSEPAELAERLDAEVVPIGLGDTVPAGVERLVVAGGDGSIGPCAEAASVAGVPLAVLPVGTANDFARFHGLPFDLDAAIALATAGERTIRLELARIDGRPFVNVASGGLAPVAAEKAQPLKGVLGPAAYAVGAVAAGVTADRIHCVARVDGEVVFDDEAWQVIVASSGAFGGGAEVEEADPADGRLDLVAVPAGSRLALPGRAAAMRRGDLAAQDDVLHRTGREITLTVAEATLFNVDGEIVACQTGTVAFTVQPAAYSLIIPTKI
jgi:diacylglycerol kinase family enzyme